MPTYEYFCESCDEKFEKILAISKHRDCLPCPTCRKKAAQITSAVAPAIFKGSGFHVNEYGAPTR